MLDISENNTHSTVKRVNRQLADLSQISRDAQCAEIARIIRAEGLEVVRFSFADQHGVLRGKTLVAEAAIAALQSGVSMTTTLVAKDSSHRTVLPIWSKGAAGEIPEFQGAADVLMIADPSTFRILPWSPKSGWIQCELSFQDKRAFPFCTRQQLRRATQRLADRGMDLMAGLEVEFHLFKMLDPALAAEHATQPGKAPDVGLISRGYQYLTEQRYDQIEPLLDMLRHQIEALAMPLRTVEVEFGPSQCEFTFAPTLNMIPADLMVLFRSAVKQVAARNGYHASFMCRPQIANTFASGWHLHQSLVSRESGANLFMAETAADQPLSDLGMRYLAGLLDHARAGALFTTPTINGYKRYRDFSLAPSRATWACDNRGVMARVLGRAGDRASRIENRVGEPLANPYLYLASQIHAGLDGIDRQLAAGPSADSPYESDAPLLPRSMAEALGLLQADPFFQEAFGSGFIQYYTRIKAAELARFNAEITDWEQREYFDMF